MSRRQIRVRVLATLALLAAIPLGASSSLAPQQAAPAAVPAAQARKGELAGVPNFGRVTATLYRGGQPSAEGFQELKKLGIEIVVNFRNEHDEIAGERREVAALGLRYVSIPWSSWHRPDDRQVAEFLLLLRANVDKKVFVHCHHGADRTGVMVAAFRIAFEHWTPAQALAEMGEFHFHRFWYPHLKSYVEELPQELLANPQFHGLQPAAHRSAP